jgi:hypothetical protein
VLLSSFQLQYLFLYFIITHLAPDEESVIRYAALLRGTQSAWQAVSYGLESVTIFAQVGGVYLNFGLWAIAILPAWLVIRHFGPDYGGQEPEGRTPDSRSERMKIEVQEEAISKGLKG